MIIDGITTVDGKTIDASELASIDTASAGNLASQRYSSNGIYNGKMQISQRGDFTTATTMATSTYFLDRWITTVNPVTADFQHIIDGHSAGVNSLKSTATSTGSGLMRWHQPIEDFSKYSGRVITFSAYVKSNSADARLLTITDSTTWMTGDNHTGGGDWELLTMTVTMPTITTSFNVFVGIDGINSANVSITSGDYIEFTDVRLDIGDTRLSGDREYAEELALCQRYYYQNLDGIYGTRYTTANSMAILFFPTKMRVAPTVTYGQSGGGSLLSDNSTEYMFRAYYSDISIHINTIKADAEL